MPCHLRQWRTIVFVAAIFKLAFFGQGYFNMLRSLKAAATIFLLRNNLFVRRNYYLPLIAFAVSKTMKIFEEQFA
jgi:hypothetical protein